MKNDPSYHGLDPADYDHLTDILLRLAQLACRHPRIEELDLNPYLAAPVGKPSVAVDVRIRLGADQGSPSGYTS